MQFAVGKRVPKNSLPYLSLLSFQFSHSYFSGFYPSGSLLSKSSIQPVTIQSKAIIKCNIIGVGVCIGCNEGSETVSLI